MRDVFCLTPVSIADLHLASVVTVARRYRKTQVEALCSNSPLDIRPFVCHDIDLVIYTIS